MEMPDKGKGRATNAQLSSDNPGSSATGTDRFLAGQRTESVEGEKPAKEENTSIPAQRRFSGEANNHFASVHRSSSPNTPSTTHLRPSTTLPISSFPSSSHPAIPAMQSQPSPSLSESLKLILRCPLCRPHRLLQSPYTLRCGHTVCAHHIHPTSAGTSASTSSSTLADGANVPPCPLNLPPCISAYSSGPQSTYVHPQSGVVIGMAPAPPVQPDPVSAAHHSGGPSSPTSPHPPRIDITTSKILSLVLRAQSQTSGEEPLVERVPTYGDDPEEHTDSEGDDDSGSDIQDEHSTRSGSDDDDLYASPSPKRASSCSHSSPPHHRRKRHRRHTFRPSHTSASRHATNGAESSTGDAPTDPNSRFEKELFSELTCEICFALMWKPITTPCQHVSVPCICNHIIPRAMAIVFAARNFCFSALSCR